MRVDAAGNSSTVFEIRNTVSCEKFGRGGRQSGRETTCADVRLSGTRRAARRPLHCGHIAQAGDLELRRRYCVIRHSDPSVELLLSVNVTGSEPASVICILAGECRAFCVQRECLFVLRGRYVL